MSAPYDKPLDTKGDDMPMSGYSECTDDTTSTISGGSGAATPTTTMAGSIFGDEVIDQDSQFPCTFVATDRTVCQWSKPARDRKILVVSLDVQGRSSLAVKAEQKWPTEKDLRKMSAVGMQSYQDRFKRDHADDLETVQKFLDYCRKHLSRESHLYLQGTIGMDGERKNDPLKAYVSFVDTGKSILNEASTLLDASAACSPYVSEWVKTSLADLPKLRSTLCVQDDYSSGTGGNYQCDIIVMNDRQFISYELTKKKTLQEMIVDHDRCEEVQRSEAEPELDRETQLESYADNTLPMTSEWLRGTYISLILPKYAKA